MSLKCFKLSLLQGFHDFLFPQLGMGGFLWTHKRYWVYPETLLHNARRKLRRTHKFSYNTPGCVSAVLGLFCKSASLYNIIVCTFKILCFGGAWVWDSVMPLAWPYMKKFFTCIMEKSGDSHSHQRSFFGDLMNILYFTAVNPVLIQCDRTTICLTDIPAQMARNALIVKTHKL